MAELVLDSRSGGRSRPTTDSHRRFTDVDVAGVDSPPGIVDPRLSQGAHFEGSVGVPDIAAPGEPITLTGAIHFDCPYCFFGDRACRVRVSSPALPDDEVFGVGNLGNCESNGFNFDVDPQAEVGQTVTLNVHAEWQEELGGLWTVGEERQFKVDIVTDDEKQRIQRVNRLPWVAVGAGAGYLWKRNAPSRTMLLATGGGGAAGYLAYDILDGNPWTVVPNVDFNVPAVQLAALGLAGIGLAAALDAIPGLGGVDAVVDRAVSTVRGRRG